MNQYTLFWLTGKREIIKGETISDAFMNAGYGGGAFLGIDFYATGDNKDYNWNSDENTWVRKEKL